MSKGTYLRRKAAGLCVKCGGEIEEDRKGKTCCFNCTKKDAEDKQSDREFRRKLGICPRCGKNKLVGDEKNCLECREKNLIYREKWYSENPEKGLEHHRNWNTKRREKRLQREAEGKCNVCGNPLADGDYPYKSCRKCREKRKSKHITSVKPKAEYKVFVWISQGKCPHCGKELYGKHGVCKEHYLIFRENGLKAKEGEYGRFNFSSKG